jgi:ornithine carbamoyltransferase
MLKQRKLAAVPKGAASAAPAHVRSDMDLSVDALRQALDLAGDMKKAPRKYAKLLAGQYLGLLFEKPSLRTRLAFELAMKQLGGDAVVSSGVLGSREPVKDVARNLGRFTQIIAARVFAQATVDELAEWGGVPVINALSDLYHPCQALADAQTLKEYFGKWEGLKVAYVGDGNNVAHSLMLTLTRLGAEVAVACPKGYEPDKAIVKTALAAGPVTVTQHPREAVQGAHAVYTDVWASMGQEHEAEERRSIFAPYQVDETLMSAARADAVFMHCLPAHRGEEVTEGVIESPQSVVFDQAENRLHTQKALLAMLLGSPASL